MPKDAGLNFANRPAPRTSSPAGARGDRKGGIGLLARPDRRPSIEPSAEVPEGNGEGAPRKDSKQPPCRRAVTSTTSGRYGKLELENRRRATRVQGKDAGQRLLEDWDLDLG